MDVPSERCSQNRPADKKIEASKMEVELTNGPEQSQEIRALLQFGLGLPKRNSPKLASCEPSHNHIGAGVRLFSAPNS